MFVGGPNVRDDYHMDQGEEVRKNTSQLLLYKNIFIFHFTSHEKAAIQIIIIFI